MIKFAGRFSMLKVTATLAAVMILICTGWAAAKMYEKFFTKVSVTLERSPTQERKLPDGRNLFISGLITTVVDPDDPKALETAKRHHEEMKQLLAQKKYDFIKAYRDHGPEVNIFISSRSRTAATPICPFPCLWTMSSHGKTIRRSKSKRRISDKSKSTRRSPPAGSA